MLRFHWLLLAVLLSSSVVLAAEAEPYTVDKFLREADLGGGQAAVVGVVCKVEAGKGRFSLADTKKFGCCDKPENCVAGVLPVRWTGKIPSEGEKARVRGKVVVEGTKLAFEASDVKVLEAKGK